MTSKIRIKAGNIEIEFEGSDEYLKNELPSLLQLIYSLGPIKANLEDLPSEELATSTEVNKKKIQMTTNNISAKLNVKGGRDLVIAACAHLSLVKGVEVFSRGDILAEMKLASNYYNENMSKNLSAALKSLVSNNKLLEPTKENYALQAKTRVDLETKLNEY